CVVCQNRKPSDEIVVLDCGKDDHAYCHDCLRDLFESSMTDAELFPPRCCRKAIPTQKIGHLFTSDFRQRFMARKAKLTSSNPLYCSSKVCSKFIGLEKVSNKNATCPDCKSITCTLCKGTAHSSLSCPIDPDTQQVEELGKQEGWKTCPGCSNLIGHRFGCWHMTCRCGHQFCYLCTKKWKSCTCAHFDGPRLLERAEFQARRPGQFRADRTEEYRIRAERRRLEENIACGYSMWHK
ncbi:hypothetical protein EJ08DRAFT_571527, partial [Tothia fuscella]